MSRNFGLGTRDLSSAGRIALDQIRSRGNISFSTVGTVDDRWRIFAKHAKSQGIGRMERVTPDLVRDYGRELAIRVEGGDMSSATAQNYVSAVNTVMKAATGGAWLPISPVEDCGIEQRSAVRTDAPATLGRIVYYATLATVRDACGERGTAIVELCREIGLRSKEASLLDSKASLRDATAFGRISITEGTKGGRKRILEIRPQGQMDALRAAAVVQGDDSSMIPTGQTWKTWRERDLREIREATRAASGGGLHDLRAAYACERYEALTGHPAPCAGGVIADHALDHAARMTIAEELGHARVEVVSEYIGGRR